MAPGELEELVRGLGAPVGGDVIVGTDTGDDAGVVRVSGSVCAVLTVDFITPIMNDPRRFGQVAAANAMSDVYAMGARPTAALNLCHFPEALPKSSLRGILEGAAERAAEGDCAIVGGHTVDDDELKYGLCVMGVVEEDDLVRHSTARPGDRLVLSKPIGTGVTLNGALAGEVDDADLLATVDVMTRLNREASEAMVEAGVSAASDVTGFGLARHAHEMARSSGVALRLELEAVPLLPWALDLVRRGVSTGLTGSNRASVSDHVELTGVHDPDRVELLWDPQTSGGLLISVPADRADGLVEELVERGYPETAAIGEVEEGEPGAIQVI